MIEIEKPNIESVILSDDGVSTKDYLEAYEAARSENIIVFPNSSDAILSAVQAGNLYKKSSVTVMKTRTIAECYAALPAADFEEIDVGKVTKSISEVLTNLFVASVSQRKSLSHQTGKDTCHGEYYSFSGKNLITSADSLAETVVQTIHQVIAERDKEIVTIFYQKRIPEDDVDAMIGLARERGVTAEFYAIPSDNLPCFITISFE